MSPLGHKQTLGLFRPKTLDRLDPDQKWSSKCGAPHEDIQNARRIIGHGQGWIDRLYAGAIDGISKHVGKAFSETGEGLVVVSGLNSVWCASAIARPVFVWPVKAVCLGMRPCGQRGPPRHQPLRLSRRLARVSEFRLAYQV